MKPNTNITINGVSIEFVEVKSVNGPFWCPRNLPAPIGNTVKFFGEHIITLGIKQIVKQECSRTFRKFKGNFDEFKEHLETYGFSHLKGRNVKEITEDLLKAAEINDVMLIAKYAKELNKVRRNRKTK